MVELSAAWLTAGFILMGITGALLFWSHAYAAYQSYAFRTKLVLLCLAGLNAAIYHLTVYRRMNDWDTAARPPIGARFAGWASLVLWILRNHYGPDRKHILS